VTAYLDYEYNDEARGFKNANPGTQQQILFDAAGGNAIGLLAVDLNRTDRLQVTRGLATFWFAELSADAAPGGVQTESHKTFVSNLKNGTVLLDVSHFSKLRMTGEPKIIHVRRDAKPEAEPLDDRQAKLRIITRLHDGAGYLPAATTLKTKVVWEGEAATKSSELDPPGTDVTIDGIPHRDLRTYFEPGEMEDIRLYKLCSELDKESTINMYEQDDLGIYALYSAYNNMYTTERRVDMMEEDAPPPPPADGGGAAGGSGAGGGSGAAGSSGAGGSGADGSGTAGGSGAGGSSRR
jgi:hypothetical protein